MKTKQLALDALKLLVSYTRACEGLLNASPAGQIGVADEANAALTADLAAKVEPVAKVVLTEKLGLPCLQWLDLEKQFEMADGQLLYASPQAVPAGFVLVPIEPTNEMVSVMWYWGTKKSELEAILKAAPRPAP